MSTQPVAYVSTPLIAFATVSFAQKARLAGRTFVHHLSDQSLVPAQPAGELGEERPVRLTVAEAVGSLAALWFAIDAAVVDRERAAAHRIPSQRRLASVNGYRHRIGGQCSGCDEIFTIADLLGVDVQGGAVI
jgi:hypothetical protein